jgi:hypothetical protein
VTQASREDVQEGSPRNERIVEHISRAFIQAVLGFCKHPRLRYTWMRFLPQNNYPYTGLWKRLVDMIRKNLATEAVLFPRTERGLYRIGDLRKPCGLYCDAEGHPLFGDVEPEMWMSQHYEAEDIEILRSWGLESFSTQDLLRMVWQDLSLPDSRMKSEQTDDDWHTRAATMLSEMASKQEALHTLRQLELIPCRGSPTYWMSVASFRTKVSLAKSEEGIPVPDDLPLQVITSEACRNPKRVAFFKQLGLEFFDTIALRDWILRRHAYYRNSFMNTYTADVQVLVDQMKFLYLTQHKDPASEYSTYAEVAVIDDRGEFWVGSYEDQPLYIWYTRSDPYGPRELLQITEAGETPGSGAPGMPARFLHSRYFLDPPRKPTPDSKAWSAWLQSYTAVQDSLRLIDSSGSELSAECYYVAEHRPEKFLGLLHHHWRLGKMDDREWHVMGERLKQLTVLCRGDRRVATSETYLPLSDLQGMCCRFLTKYHRFPFLYLDECISRETYAAKKWDFLVKFAGVRVDEDLAFYLAILGEMRKSEQDPQTAIRVVELYRMIYMKYSHAQFEDRGTSRGTRTTAQAQIRYVFGFFPLTAAKY